MILLGSTGSIGVNALKIAQKFHLKVEAICANKSVDLLNQQISSFQPKYVAIGDKSLKHKVHHNHVFCGDEGIVEMLERCEDNLVVNALVGFAGLRPTIKSIELQKKVALANKESLVAGGAFVDTSCIQPIDSEHFGLWYLLNDKKPTQMILTASGGAFRDTPLEKLPFMGVKDALKHPNWSMGDKITIDSATMTNKLFELLEAKWLFECERFDAVIETNSLVHALIEFEDGSTTAHFAYPDMILPISYALLEKVKTPILPNVDLKHIGKIEFKSIELNRYPIWEIKETLLEKPKLGVVVNAANEIGVEQFLGGKIDILELVRRTKKALQFFENSIPSTIEDVFEIDLHVREFCQKG